MKADIILIADCIYYEEVSMIHSYRFREKIEAVKIEISIPSECQIPEADLEG